MLSARSPTRGASGVAANGDEDPPERRNVEMGAAQLYEKQCWSILVYRKLLHWGRQSRRGELHQIDTKERQESCRAAEGVQEGQGAAPHCFLLFFTATQKEAYLQQGSGVQMLGVCTALRPANRA